MAINPKTGRTIWKQQRKTNVYDESFETYSTPVPFVRGGRVELLNTGADFITAHDPATGKELWRYEYWLNKVRDSRTIPSLVTGGGLIFGSRHKHNGVFAIRPLGGGSGAKITWEFNEAATDCSTPLFYQDRVYVLDGIRRGKVVACLDAKTGKQLWQGRIGGSGPWWASLTAGDGKLYCINEDGDIVVLRAGGEKFEIIFQTRIDEPRIQSSISIANGRLYIRTAENLYCISK
jgi:outer membrane protein assembly factor BamB